jgi:hypothetical protein
MRIADVSIVFGLARYYNIRTRELTRSSSLLGICGQWLIAAEHPIHMPTVIHYAFASIGG